MIWTNEDKRALISALRDPYKFKVPRSLRSLKREQSCYNPSTLINLITPQIQEIIDKGLPYETPDLWDKSFEILGGGQGRRKSRAILKIMNWEQFMDKFNEIKTNF